MTNTATSPADSDQPRNDAATDAIDAVTTNGTPADKLVPVAESIRHRRRAQQAETQLQEVRKQIDDLQSQLSAGTERLATVEAQRDEAQSHLTVLNNRSTAERILSRCGVVDLEASSELLAKRVDLGQEIDMDAIQRGVEQLLLDKPFLRGAGPALPKTTAAARNDPIGRAAVIAQAAQRAAGTGDRRDVAQYLRLRRQAAAATGR